MKKLFIFIFLNIFFFNSYLFSQVGKIENDTLTNYIDINNKKQGKWLKKYSNGKTRYKGQFLNDIPVGVFYYYLKTGKMESVLNYDDSGNCSAEFYWENGNLAGTGFYNAEKQRVKTWKINFEDGNLAMIINYDNKGNLNGNNVMYYPESKNKVVDCNYSNGKLNGKYTKYFKNGSLQEEGYYVNGKRHGHWKLYTPEAICDEEGEYVNGSREGQWKIYDKDLQKFVTANYKFDRSDLDEKKMKEWQNKLDWAKENQDKFKQPEDYFDNPELFFRGN
ncbi:MAG: hypothetical protein LBV69_09860 [Bacteroidales bacterium]|jgi:antitoxin component YwqK of YwqJK toxin-antitoxin module|nr:hypothetical protein [Bacteroidales bacterium]